MKYWIFQGNPNNFDVDGYLKEKTIAHWIAINKANDLRISGDWPSIGVKRGSEVMAGEEWRWQTKVSKTDSKNAMRVDIEVQHERELGGKAVVTTIISRL